MNKKIFELTLLIAAILSTMYILILGWYNLPSLDDYIMINEVEHVGAWQWMVNKYFSWQGRFSTFLLGGLLMQMFGHAENWFLWTVIMLLTGWIVVERLFTGFCRKKRLMISRVIIMSASVLTVNVGIMGFIDPSMFFWLCCNGYVFSIWATILLFFALFFSDVHSWLRWLMVIVSSLYISGSAENYTPLVIILLFAILMIRIGKKLGRLEVNSMIFISLVILAVGFFVMIMAPGNKVRMEAAGYDAGIAVFNMTLVEFVFEIVRSSLVLMMRLLSRSFFYFFILFTFEGIGLCCNRTDTSLSKLGKKHLALVFCSLIGIIVLATSICVIGVYKLPPVRAVNYMSFVMVLFCAYIGLRLGLCSNKANILMKFVVLSNFILIITTTKMIMQNAPIAKSYHDYIVKRNISIIERSKNNPSNKDPFVCEPFGYKWENNTYSKMKNICYIILGKEPIFYEPDMIYMESDLSPNPDDFRNYGLQMYLNVDFPIVYPQKQDMR